MKNKFIHFMILTNLVAGGSFALVPNLQAQGNFDIGVAIEARDYQALTRYYRGLADDQRAIAEDYHQKLYQISTSRGGRYSIEAHYRNLHDEALEKADEYDALAEKYEVLINGN